MICKTYDRYEKDREKKRLAHRRAVLRIESEIAERLRKIQEIDLQTSEEKEKVNKAVAELLNLRRVRCALFQGDITILQMQFLFVSYVFLE